MFLFLRFNILFILFDVTKIGDKAENACCQTENFYLCID